MKHKEIAKLVEQAKKDPEAFGRLYDMYEPKIYSFIASRVINPADAEDLTARTFEKALRGIRSFNAQKASFSTWLFRIANNVVIDYLRHQGYFQMLSLDDAIKIYRFDKEVEPDIKRYYIMVMQLIGELPPNHQEVLSLKFFEGKNNKEIAEILGCSHSHMCTRVIRALRALRKLVDEKGILDELRETIPGE